MSIELNKKTGINLSKGSKISLEKDGKRLERVCVGLNWGAIKHVNEHSFLGFIKWDDTRVESVDLDGSVTLFDAQKQHCDTVYYRKLRSNDGAIVHSGDDLSGDHDGDDDRDNEVLVVNLLDIDPRVQSIVFYLNSYKGQDFARVPYAKIRVFEGTLQRVESVFATFNLAAEQRFRGYVSMVMGKLVRKPNGKWEFITIGEPISARNIEESIAHIQQHYL